MGGKKWFRAVDTGRESPEDILAPGNEQVLGMQNEYMVRDGSLVVLLSKWI